MPLSVCIRVYKANECRREQMRAGYESLVVYKMESCEDKRRNPTLGPTHSCPSYSLSEELKSLPSPYLLLTKPFGAHTDCGQWWEQHAGEFTSRVPILLLKEFLKSILTFRILMKIVTSMPWGDNGCDNAWGNVYKIARLHSNHLCKKKKKKKSYRTRLLNNRGFLRKRSSQYSLVLHKFFVFYNSVSMNLRQFISGKQIRTPGIAFAN